jgi:anaerobic ribonucleoside-triphosphate reductase
MGALGSVVVGIFGVFWTISAHVREMSCCPYCGDKIMDEEHQYCKKCGKALRS